MRLALVLAALAALLGLSACGPAKNTLNAGSEGEYVRLGHLKYQVQLSRQLNPADVEDASYLRGLTPAERALAPGQAFFGVWLRVENASGQPRDPAIGFHIADTRGTTYSPLVPDASNPFAYRALSIPPHGQIPNLDSVDYASATQGALILFKVDAASYEDRPLTLSIDDGSVGRTGTVELDV